MIKSTEIITYIIISYIKLFNCNCYWSLAETKLNDILHFVEMRFHQGGVDLTLLYNNVCMSVFVNCLKRSSAQVLLDVK